MTDKRGKKKEARSSLRELTDLILLQEDTIKQQKVMQKGLKRLSVRERLAILLDNPASFLELNIWAGFQMYESELPAAGVVTGIGNVNGRACMVIANDATVKAGAMFPQSVKKVLRAQRIAYDNLLPILYLVDSSGVFLPLQAEIFPDEDDFGRIFRNNAVLSAQGIPQFAAIMGNCIAGGGYLPVLCDKLLMTEGSGLYLAGPALVKAAIGQEVDKEELGGAKMHAELSGTVDFLEKDDPNCLQRLRALVDLLPPDPKIPAHSFTPGNNQEVLYDLISADGDKEYDTRELIETLCDQTTVQEYQADFGKTIVCAFGKIAGIPIGIVANQRKKTFNGKGEIEIGGVIYANSADKAARFILDCNQMKIPLLFLQDVVGFMVGKEAEQSGIIKSGAKLVNAVSNSIVPKITVIVGNSFGAGNYALCGKAYDPRFIFAWPNAKYAVMGASQAVETLNMIHPNATHEKVQSDYERQMEIRFGAARGWIDAIIAPDKTREILIEVLHLVKRRSYDLARFHTGVLQT